MKTVTQTILYRQALIEYSAKVEHLDVRALRKFLCKRESKQIRK